MDFFVAAMSNQRNRQTHSITYLLGIIIAIDVSVSLVRVVQFSVLLSRDSMVPLKALDSYHRCYFSRWTTLQRPWTTVQVVLHLLPQWNGYQIWNYAILYGYHHWYRYKKLLSIYQYTHMVSVSYRKLFWWWWWWWWWEIQQMVWGTKVLGEEQPPRCWRVDALLHNFCYRFFDDL